jgi:transglutaminase-like putative cysteine protease
MRGCRLFFFAAALICSACKPKMPVIESISPKIGRMGEAVTITGANFGKERAESYITIAGTAPTSSSYERWQDDLISVKIPEFGESGLIYVFVKGKKSNGALFSNSAALPRPVYGDESGLEPRIISVDPQSGAPGSLITITGNNFGSSREQGGVFFTWAAETPLAAAGTSAPEFIEAAETEFGYEMWSDREIRLRLPDGAASGSMEVRGARGNSRPFYFDVNGKPGTKIFRDKRSYIISYSVDVKTGEASRPNTLYLWVPLPQPSPSQRNVSLISRNVEPFVENHRGTGLFKFDNMTNNGAAQIQLAYSVDVYAQETAIRLPQVRQDASSPMAPVYTQGSPLVKAEDPEIKSQAAAIAGRERNPYLRAQQIYEWCINQEERDPYDITLRYCAMLRASGVPCLPVAGVLVNRSRQTLIHYWAEFWIDGFGWIPADPAMGAGAVPAAFVPRQDAATFYFGNMDNQRVAFSRGETNLSQMDPRGRPVSRSRSYALQNLWEEAIGGIESYTSLWGDITITGIYVQ